MYIHMEGLGEITVRLATPADIDASMTVWLESNMARRGGRPPIPEATPRVRAHLERPSAFLLVASEGSHIVGLACPMQAIDIDGDGSDVPGLCHLALVFVRPSRWGEGIGGALVRATMDEARRRGYRRIQLWTHADNDRAQRLYETLGFQPTGRRKPDDDDGEEIIHLQRDL